MTKDMAQIDERHKEIDIEKLAKLFPAATGLMLAVHTTVLENTADDKDAPNPVHVMVTAALDPPDEYKDKLAEFAELFALIAGIFLNAAEGKLSASYPNTPSPAEDPEWPQFIGE